MRHLIGVSLNHNGNIIDLAANGVEALEKLKSKVSPKFDVVLLDKVMPLMGGFETATRIFKEVESPPYVVIMSADISEENSRMAQSLGVDYVLEKPVLYKDLVEAWRAMEARTAP